MKSSENKDIRIIITGCAFRSSFIPLIRNYFTNQNLCDTFIQQSTLSRTKPPNFRFLAYKLVYLMIVIEICHSPDISTQVSVQITGSFRVCRTFFKHPMTNFVKAIACIISSNLWHSLRFLQHIINWKML